MRIVIFISIVALAFASFLFARKAVEESSGQSTVQTAAAEENSKVCQKPVKVAEADGINVYRFYELCFCPSVLYPSKPNNGCRYTRAIYFTKNGVSEEEP